MVLQETQFIFLFYGCHENFGEFIIMETYTIGVVKEGLRLSTSKDEITARSWQDALLEYIKKNIVIHDAAGNQVFPKRKVVKFQKIGRTGISRKYSITDWGISDQDEP